MNLILLAAPKATEGVVDVLETRLVIEIEALMRSLRKGDIAWETQVVGSYHVLSRVPIPRGPGDDAESWARHHRRFHMSLLSAVVRIGFLSLPSSCLTKLNATARSACVSCPVLS
jgi:DNA-binding GntR family transcriptional regulator